MMSKKTFSRLSAAILLLLTVSIPVGAQEISVEAARQAAASFLKGHAAKLPAKSRKGMMKAPPKAESLQLVYTQEDQLHESPAFYVFEQPKQGGFVIASADERVAPIFGYFEEGNFQDAVKESCCFKAVLENIGQQIAYARENDLPQITSTLNDDNDFAPIEPITRNGVHWHQGGGDGLDDYCPMDKNTGKRCVTGCVANTMAILMYHHRWPERGVGSHSYQWRDTTLTANFGETTYRYELMGPNGGPETARLLYHCGVAVNMNYSSDGSGASPYDNNAMKNFFRYDLVKKISGDEYTKISAIHEALSHNNPLCATGNNHRFLIDGYQPGGFIHLNLHSGFANGYVHISGLKDGWYDSGGTWISNSGFYDGSKFEIDLFVPEEDVKTITVTKDNIEYAVRFNKATITKGLISGNFVIPSTVTDEDGTSYPVTSIGSQAFEGCYDLKIVTIPNSVTGIGDRAFYGCSCLTSISIPNSVTSIGAWAFYNCTGYYDEKTDEFVRLTSVNIPNSVTSIGAGAFNCTGLTSVNIPNSVTSIGSGVFSGCSSLTSISVASGNSKYDSRDNCNALIETASNTLIQGCKNTLIPNSVTSIGTSAFYLCSGLTSISIPNSVTSIGRRAFNGSSGLTNISIPNSVTSIGDDAFYNTGIWENSANGVFYVDKWACGYKGTMLANTNLVIREGTLGIADDAFYYRSGLTSITIPNSVTSIGDGAFKSCENLASVTFGNSLKIIGESAFSFCKLTSVTIPNSVANIRGYAFYGKNALTSVTSYVENPSAITEDVFGSWYGNTYDAPLYVPIGTLEKYKSTDGWKNFKNIVEIEIDGIENVTVSNSNSNISENAPMYNLSGQRVGKNYKGIVIKNGKKIIVK